MKIAGVLDSVVLIGYYVESDQWNEKAVLLLEAMDRGQKFIITDYILDETLTFIRKIAGAEKSNTVLEYLTGHPNVIMAHINEKLLKAAIIYFKRYQRLSFTDATTVALMKDASIRKIYSFDSDFDGIEGIVRVEKI